MSDFPNSHHDQLLHSGGAEDERNRLTRLERFASNEGEAEEAARALRYRAERAVALAEHLDAAAMRAVERAAAARAVAERLIALTKPDTL